jgi:hypothetical protein
MFSDDGASVREAWTERRIIILGLFGVSGLPWNKTNSSLVKVYAPQPISGPMSPPLCSGCCP